MRELNKAMEWLNQYHSKEPRLGLTRVKALAKLVNNPELKVPVIHIAGTNGKGSTVTMLSNILQQKGLKVGVFSSPYIIKYEEQFLINNQPISSEKLADYVEKYQQLFEKYADQEDIKGLTEFELITVLAYDYFAEESVDVAIMEVGLGGKEDSTNICQPILTGITTIGLDHIAILGNTIAEVAEQKAGIIKNGIPVVTGRISQEALNTIENIAEYHSSEVIKFERDFSGIYERTDQILGTMFQYRGINQEPMKFTVPLIGKHQVDNAAMAIRLFEEYAKIMQMDYSKNLIQKGLSQTFWPARMERISTQPLIILDGAHNPHALERLIDNMNSIYPDYDIEILFSCIRTKDIASMINGLERINPSRMTLTTFEHENAFSIEELETYSSNKVSVDANWQKVIQDYYSMQRNQNKVLLITGSLYFISYIRPYIEELIQK